MSKASSSETTSIISFGFGSRKKKPDDITLKSSGSFQSDLPTPTQNKMNGNAKSKKKFAIRHDGFGYQPDHHSSNVKISSLTYLRDESEASRAHQASQHYAHRGTFWNEGKRTIFVRYFQLAMIGVVQGSVAYWVNFLCHVFTEVRIEQFSCHSDLIVFTPSRTCNLIVSNRSSLLLSQL